MLLSEENKLIKFIGETRICTENTFGAFVLFANGICGFEVVEEALHEEGITFDELCKKAGVDASAII